MFAFAPRLLAPALLMLVSPAFGSAQPSWPISPSRLQLSTPYGDLQVKSSEYIYEARLQIDNTDVDPEIHGILNITYAFNMPTSQAALVSINSGNNGCPITYRWVVLKKTGYDISPEFGSCNEQIKVTAKGRHLTLQTPSTQAADKIDEYVYDGKTVKHRLRNLKKEFK
ncbi:hypothetical protein [Candidimonas sp. SYP-B2681]|uniref:hypothetical protein n=1 Tax=Candidimonas sp. SYP-B2681 TaxID=2497686 RepID=UPI000F876950|nr:hypothetical protein [Candidimonas sp. SYP-B2681]